MWSTGPFGENPHAFPHGDCGCTLSFDPQILEEKVWLWQFQVLFSSFEVCLVVSREGYGYGCTGGTRSPLGLQVMCLLRLSRGAVVI